MSYYVDNVKACMADDIREVLVKHTHEGFIEEYIGEAHWRDFIQEVTDRLEGYIG